MDISVTCYSQRIFAKIILDMISRIFVKSAAQTGTNRIALKMPRQRTKDIRTIRAAVSPD